MPATKSDAEQMAELQAALNALKVKTANERGALIQPFLASVYDTLTFADSANNKPWHGATLNAETTAPDGRKVRVNITFTDIDVTAALKKAQA